MNEPSILAFPKSRRVLKSTEFTQVLRNGACAADGVLVLFALPRSDPKQTTRIGITIPKKTGNAVVRNRWKRLIRESFRIQQERIADGYDLVVRPKKGAAPDSRLIMRAVPRLAAKAISRLPCNG